MDDLDFLKNYNLHCKSLTKKLLRLSNKAAGV